MTMLPDDPVKIPQQKVQRLLGRCLLQLQKYEQLLKFIVAHSRLSGTVDTLEANRAKRIQSTSTKTLGYLVGEFLGSYIASEDIADEDTPKSDLPDDTPSVRFRMTTKLSEADFAQTKNDLNELVSMRNNLVHHFIDAHDLWSVEGCHSAQDALIVAYDRITQNFERLRELPDSMNKSRQLIADALKSDVVCDLIVHGAAPDGKIDWSSAKVVNALRDAARELAVDGWTPVAEAGSWITERHSDQHPAKFGCHNWQQVVHEARVFELRYFEVDGQRSAWYLEKN